MQSSSLGNPEQTKISIHLTSAIWVGVGVTIFPPHHITSLIHPNPSYLGGFLCALVLDPRNEFATETPNERTRERAYCTTR